MLIDGVKIGTNSPCYIVGEISANHSGKISKLFRLINKAKSAGVNAVKIQAYAANTITIDSNLKDFRIPKKNSWEKYKNLYKLYEKGQTPLSWLPKIFKYCRKKKITVFASVFDISSLKLLKKLKCPAYKIASPEITDIPLLEEVSKTGKPIILSTGLANYQDLKLAYKTLKKNTNKIAILKCISSYPAKIEELNLNTMMDIKKQYKCPVGFSDHTLGKECSILAAAMGAEIIEKHFIENKSDKSLDSFFSLDANSLKTMINQIRDNEIAKGKIDYTITKNSKKNMNGRRSLYVVQPILKGKQITVNNVKSIRPSYGLHPKYLKNILGKKVKKNLLPGERLSLKNII
jgi:pseudaminic acid synthase